MPYFPDDTECEALNPSMCGGKYAPTLDYRSDCIGCLPRPYGKCLDKLLTPEICEPSCDDCRYSMSVTMDVLTEIPQDGFARGDVIEVNIVGKNTGSCPLKWIMINTWWDYDDVVWEHDTLDPNETVSHTLSIIVSESIVADGHLGINAYIEGLPIDSDDWDTDGVWSEDFVDLPINSTETKKTTLFTDGTFIINELMSDRATNISSHGAVVEEWTALYADNADTTYNVRVGGGLPWMPYHSAIHYVEVGSPISPTTMSRWFEACNLESCDFTGIDTSNVTDMSLMFWFDPAHAELTTLDLSMFDTSNVTDMGGMFMGRNGLVSLDLSNFDVSNVEDMGGMFSGCSALQTLILAGWDLANANNVSSMFQNCSSLRTIYVTESWYPNESISNDQPFMWYGCTSIVGGDNTTYKSAEIDNFALAIIDGDGGNDGYFTLCEV